MHAYNNPSSGEHEGRVVTEVTVTASLGKKKKSEVHVQRDSLPQK